MSDPRIVTAAVASSDGNIFFAGQKNAVCVTNGDGHYLRHWTCPRVSRISALAVVRSKLFVAHDSGVTALRPSDGTWLFESRTGHGDPRALVANDEVIFAACTHPLPLCLHQVVCLKHSGQEQFRVDTRGRVRSLALSREELYVLETQEAAGINCIEVMAIKDGTTLRNFEIAEQGGKKA